MEDGICIASTCIGIAMYSKKEGVHKIAMQQDVRHRLPHLRVMFFQKSSSMSMFKKHFAPWTDTISWTSARNTFPKSISQPAPARRFEIQLVVSTKVCINCPCRWVAALNTLKFNAGSSGDWLPKLESQWITQKMAPKFAATDFLDFRARIILNET